MCEKGTICQWKVYEGTFFVKLVYKRVKGWTSRRSLPVYTFVEYPPGFQAFRMMSRERDSKSGERVGGGGGGGLEGAAVYTLSLFK